VGSLHFQLGFSCGAIVTQEKIGASCCDHLTVGRGRIFTKEEDEPVGTRREARGRPLSVKTIQDAGAGEEGIKAVHAAEVRPAGRARNYLSTIVGYSGLHGDPA
jgi:hypothetical protein